MLMALDVREAGALIASNRVWEHDAKRSVGPATSRVW